MDAWRSLVLGLYFMVHEPSGYMPLSTPKFHWDSLVKWRTTSSSERSGKSGPSPTSVIQRGFHVAFGQGEPFARGSFFPQQGLVENQAGGSPSFIWSFIWSFGLSSGHLLYQCIDRRF
jgi:hypothetical protein